MFVEHPTYSRWLNSCKNHRNRYSWFGIGCRKICEKFEISTFSKFFEPNRKLIHKYKQFLTDQILKVKNGGRGNGVLTKSLLGKRVLEEIPKKL